MAFFHRVLDRMNYEAKTRGAIYPVMSTTTGATPTLANPTLTAPIIAAGSATAASKATIASGTLLTVPEAGAIEYNNVLYFSNAASQRGLQAAMQYARTDVAMNLVDDTSTQAIFPTANDALTVVAGESYRFRSLIKLTKGANSVSLNFAFGGSATFTTCNYAYISRAAVSGAAGAANMSNVEVATTLVVCAASTAANVVVMLDGEFEINAAGTIIPSVIWSGATGSTPSVNVGSYFECWMTGANPVTAIGPWA